MSAGGARKGAGRKKREPTKNVTFRVPLSIRDEFKNQARELLLKLRK